MEIIKHGNAVEKEYQCDVCGCEFIATKDDYTIERGRMDCTMFVCDCPECGAKLLIEEWQ